MKTKIFTLIAILSLGIVSLRAEGHLKTMKVFGNTSMKGVMKQAKNNNKPIMVYVWAKYCHESNTKMADVLAQSTVTNFLSNNFNCKEMDASNLKYQGKLSKWGISSVPSFVFLTPEGKLIETSAVITNSTDLMQKSEMILSKSLEKDQNFRDIK